MIYKMYFLFSQGTQKKKGFITDWYGKDISSIILHAFLPVSISAFYCQCKHGKMDDNSKDLNRPTLDSYWDIRTKYIAYDPYKLKKKDSSQ